APRYLLMTIYSQELDWTHVKQVSDDIFRIAPHDAEAQRYAAVAQSAKATPEQYLNLSLHHYRNGRFEECIKAAKEALGLRPDYAEAYNNIAAAYQSMQRWDDAIAAAKEALRIKPDFQLARNNLLYAMSQRSLLASKN